MTGSNTLIDGIDIEAIDDEIEESLKANLTLAIKTDLLKSLISKVERSVTKKSTQEIFKFIYLQVDEDKLTVRGMNTDFTTEATAVKNEDDSSFKITSGTPNSICLPAEKLIPIVKRLNAKNTEIRITGNNVLIKSGRPEFNLIVLDGSQFPRTPDNGSSITSISIHADILSMMYDRTIYASSTSETRPVLTGVLHDINGNKLKCASTDSHRLAQFVYDLAETYNEVSVTIPSSVLVEAKKHLDASKGEIKLHIYESEVTYEFEDVTLYARMLEGKYPDISRLIFPSEKAGSSFVVNAGAFKNLLNNSTVYSPDMPIIIRIKPEEGQLRVNTVEAEVGSFQEDLTITAGKGSDLSVAVNVRYLQEAFNRYNNDDSVRLEFMPETGTKPPGLQPFKGMLHNGDSECLELFVPVRSPQLTYKEVVIEDFTGVAEFDFNPFESDFKDIE